ncbi:prolipoprotein diacylglyceryl transferase [bacterium]|nr:MAG: prolipoprotein diacylglyceryl transferase [bacterium]
MHPLICKIGPLSIYSYGLAVALGFLAGLSLASLRAKKENIDRDIIFNFAFLVFISGVIGARLFYVLEHFSDYADSLLEIVMLQHGGMSWFGGLTLGSLCGLIYLKKKQVPVYKVLDLIVPFLALAQAIGRIGCLLNGCCFGKVSSFGIYFPVHQAILIPTQLYSSLFLLLIFIILRFLQESPHQPGQILFTYLFLYSLKRFFIEFLRADNPRVIMGLTLFQLISITILCLAVYKLISINRSKT